MSIIPPKTLIDFIRNELFNLLTENPAATSSEAFVQHSIEFALINAPITPRYFLRIGINYHGNKVQHIRIDENGILIGWNPEGDALGIGNKAKMLLASKTIYERDKDEQSMSDTKIGGGDIPIGSYVRAEFKSRGWLGKTKNLDGKQLEKDIELLKKDKADLLVICLSETAYRKWRGEGPTYQANRRTGTNRFREIFVGLENLKETIPLEINIKYENQNWTVLHQRVIGSPSSIMPYAEHIITMCWRR